MNIVSKHISLAVALTALLVASCADGPSGPDPGQELLINYPGNLGQDLTERKSADMIITGDSINMQRVVTLSGRAFEDRVEFQGGQSFNPLQRSVITVYFGSSNPTSSTWTPVDFSDGEPSSLPNGVRLRIDAVNYYPIEGSTTITSGFANGNSVGGAVGFFSGKLRSINGAEITVQSCIFSHPRP